MSLSLSTVVSAGPREDAQELRKTLEAFNQVAQQGDLEAAKKLAVVGPDEEPILAAMVKTSTAGRKFLDSAKVKFGPAAQALKAPGVLVLGTTSTRVVGDRGTLTEGSGSRWFFRNDGGNWKVDLQQMNRQQKIAGTIVSSKTTVAALGELTSELEAGRFKTIQELRDAEGAKLVGFSGQNAGGQPSVQLPSGRPVPVTPDASHAVQGDPKVDAAVKAVEKAGGSVATNPSRPGNPVVSVTVTGDFSDDDIAGLEAFSECRVLELSSEKLTDKTLERIGKLSQLVSLNLCGSQITGAGLVHLEGLRFLEDLSLANSPKLGDEGAKHLSALKSLTLLNLGQTAISDAGVAELKPLISLKTLFLDGTKVTGASFKELAGMTKLNVLSLDDTKVTDEGLAPLTALPALKILKLSRTAVTDAGLLLVRQMKTLKLIDLSGTKVTPGGIEGLKKERSGLNVSGR